MSGQVKNSNDGLTITVKQDNEVSGEQFSNSSQVEILLKGIVGFPPWILKSVIPQPADLLTKKWLRSKKAAPYNILGPLHWSYLRDTVFQIKRSFWSFWRELCISYYLITFLGQLQWKRDSSEWVLCSKSATLVPCGWQFLSNVSNIFVCLLYSRGCCALPFLEMIQILE